MMHWPYSVYNHQHFVVASTVAAAVAVVVAVVVVAVVVVLD